MINKTHYREEINEWLHNYKEKPYTSTTLERRAFTLLNTLKDSLEDDNEPLNKMTTYNNNLLRCENGE